MIRLLVVAALLGLFLAARVIRTQGRPARRVSARMPVGLVDSTRPTWVIFTTRYCASCGPVADELAAAFPGDAVVTLDVADHPDLARELSVRRAPTVFGVDRQGDVTRRLVGADAVRSHLRARALVS